MRIKFKSAMVVILNKNDKVLLLKRSKDSNWMPEKWGLPGGHVEEYETTKQGAIRETLEETTLQLKELATLHRKNDVMIYYSTLFDGNVKIDHEHTDWSWVSYEQISNWDTTPNMKEIVKLALEK